MKSYKITLLGLFLSFSLILSYIETLIPFYFGIPGMKLGLANLTVILVLYVVGTKEAFAISIIRVLLVGFLFTNLYSIAYSLAGAFISFLTMLIMKKTDRFSMTGVSIGGGVTHNLGQLIVAAVVIDTVGVWYYLPVLLLTGLVTGALIGILATSLKIPMIKILHKEADKDNQEQESI